MSMESDLSTLLKSVCVRSFPDVAPENTVTPYVVWQQLGGESARLLNNAAADKRNSYLQVSVWSSTRQEALTMIRQIEDLMCASPSFTARPESESVSMYEQDTKRYGSIQRFDVWATR